MQEFGTKSTRSGLDIYPITNASEVYWNLTSSELIEHALANGEGVLTDNGALMCDTGEFTGRAPKDRYIVKDENTEDTIWWGEVNFPFDPDKFDSLYNKLINHLEGKKLYVREAYAGVDHNYRLNLRVINTMAWHNLFCNNLFLRPDSGKLDDFEPTFTIINAPEFLADPEVDRTRQKNFVIINFTRNLIILGGTAYAGEMKKGIFSVLNYILPHKHNVLPMHCSANIGPNEDTAIFFGLSGTGKTTLSADPNRDLIGDDEHGWTDNSIFNFEGGCYAKAIDLSRDKEPEIWDAIKYGAVVENTRFYKGTRTLDFSNASVTENTRTAYPIDHIANARIPSVGGIPNNIFFLTCDAYGVLPPISKLNKSQAMYHFISGYTAKVAGTETGITEPQIVFSACFGLPFLPLHPTKYAEMLGKKMEENKVNIWLVNTGWSGGPYGIGKRMSLKYTRAIITAALEGKLEDVNYTDHEVFGIAVPTECPEVPTEILDPKSTWENKDDYDIQANKLAIAFNENFTIYSDFANQEILSGAPKANIEV